MGLSLGSAWRALDDLQKEALQTIDPGADRREVLGRRCLTLVRPFQCATQKPCARYGIAQKLGPAVRNDARIATCWAGLKA
jgi:hypothetical protein